MRSPHRPAHSPARLPTVRGDSRAGVCGPIRGGPDRAYADGVTARATPPTRSTIRWRQGRRRRRFAGLARSSPCASIRNWSNRKGRSGGDFEPRISSPVHGRELSDSPGQRSDVGVDLMRQGFPSWRVIEEVSDLKEVATVTPTHASRFDRQGVGEGNRPAAQGNCRIVEFRASGCTEPEGEYAPHLVLRVGLLTSRYRSGAACAYSAACLHHVGHLASPLMAAFDRVLCRDNCAPCSSRYRWRQA